MAATMQFDVRMAAAARRREGGAARLLLLGDFSGRAHRGLADAASLGRRAVIPVDIDSLDDAIARCTPRVEGTLDDGTRVNLSPTSLEDFHPDRILLAHRPLASQMALRRRLLDPSQFAAAAQELGATASEDPQASAPEDDRTTIGRLLGDTPARAAAGSNAAAQSAVDAFLRRTVAADDQASALQFQPQYLAAVEAPAATQLRALLHLDAFQALEATWRGVQFLVSRLELGDELELYLLDVTLDELRADAAVPSGGEPESQLARRFRALADEAADADATWLVAGALFTFGSGDLDVLAALGRTVRRAGIPIVAGADETIAGSFPDASEWRRPDAGAAAQWQSLRGQEIASSIGLICPRFLLRLPYGAASDAIDGFPFEELAAAVPSRRELLWAEGALAAMLVLARGSQSGAFDVDDLPALTYFANGERALLPCAEWLIGERIGNQLIDHGLMPLLGSRHRNAVRLAGWRSIALGSS